MVPAAERDTIGRYELLLELGRGGMAVLYLARAGGVGGFSRLFAIKRILPHLAADPVFVDMFLDEGRIAARLSHPNLCPVFELGQDRGELFLVMEYLDGVPWEALAAAAPRDARGLALTAGVLAQACEGLHHAHTFRDVDGVAMPIVHRDVSPQNVFVSADGTCRVLDFGVSKISTDPRRTRTGVRKGKLPYMAPEQIRGEPLDGRTDVWALGVMVWEALTGARLFDRDTDFLTYQAITDAPIPSLQSIRPDRYPAAVDRVLARALARDRDQRYATARDLGRALAELAGSLPAPLGGAGSRDAIAAAVSELCGAQLAARREAIATALGRRSPLDADEPIASRAAVTQVGPAALAAAGAAVRVAAVGAAAGADAGGEPGDTLRDASTADRDAAATVSMAMRRDAIVVGPRRSPGRRRRVAVAALAVAAAGAALTLALALRTPSTPAREPSPALVASAPVTSAAPAPPTVVVADGDAGRHARDASDPTPPRSAVALDGTADRSPPTTTRSTHRAAAAAGSGSTAPRPATSGARARDRRAVDATEPRAAAASPAAGSYAIDSAPYATIYIDDRKIGDTPLDRIALPAGKHRVRAVLADGRERTFAIDIAADRKTSEGTLRW